MPIGCPDDAHRVEGGPKGGALKGEGTADSVSGEASRLDGHRLDKSGVATLFNCPVQEIECIVLARSGEIEILVSFKTLNMRAFLCQISGSRNGSTHH